MTEHSADKHDSTGVHLCSGGAQAITLAERLKQARKDEETASSTY